jgi:hypothetical protein
LAIPQQHKRGPELDAKAAPKGTAWPIFNLNVSPVRVLAQGITNDLLCGLAMPTPCSAKLEQYQPGHCLYIDTGRGL